MENQVYLRPKIPKPPRILKPIEHKTLASKVLEERIKAIQPINIIDQANNNFENSYRSIKRDSNSVQRYGKLDPLPPVRTLGHNQSYQNLQVRKGIFYFINCLTQLSTSWSEFKPLSWRYKNRAASSWKEDYSKCEESASSKENKESRESCIKRSKRCSHKSNYFYFKYINSLYHRSIYLIEKKILEFIQTFIK